VCHWSDEETDDPRYADRRNFYKVEKWSHDDEAAGRQRPRPPATRWRAPRLIWINFVNRRPFDASNYDFARERLMGAFDLQIGWFHKHKASAEEAVRDLKRGRKIEIDEKDVTQEWIVTYEQIIAKYRELIAAYKARSH